MPFASRDQSQARRRFVGPFLQAVQGNLAPLDAWLTRLEKKAAAGDEHPLLALDAWTHHRPLRGDPSAPAALAPLQGLLDAELPADIKARAIALTQTLRERTDPATLTKWHLGIGVSATSWLRAWDVPEVQAFARRYLTVFDHKGLPREDWSFPLLNDLLATVSHDSAHHAYLRPERRARLWEVARTTGMVRDDALIDVRTAAPVGQMPSSIQSMARSTDAHTALEWLLPSEEPGGLVDAWLARHGVTPAWPSPATGASLTWLAFAHPSPRLLQHWLANDSTLLDQPMVKGTWGQRKELSGSCGVVLGGRYVPGSVIAKALTEHHAATLNDWLRRPVVTVRQTLMVLGQAIGPAWHTDTVHVHQPQATAPDPWGRWAEAFVLRSALDEVPSLAETMTLPIHGRARL